MVYFPRLCRLAYRGRLTNYMFKKYENAVCSLKKKLQTLIADGFLHILMGDMLNKGVFLLSSIFLVRLLDKNIYAYMSYSDNLYSYITLLAGAGLSTAILRSCLSSNSDELNKSYMLHAVQRGSIINLLLSIALVIGVCFVPIPYEGARVYIFALIFYQSLYHVLNSILSYMRSNRWNKSYARIGVTFSVLMLVTNVLLTLAIRNYGFVVARYLSVIVAIIIAIMMIPKHYREILSLKIEKQRVKEMNRLGISFMIVNLFSGIMPLNETFLVNNLIASEEVTANFKVASIMPQLLFVVTGAVMVYFFTIVVNTRIAKQVQRIVLNVGIINFAVIVLLTGIGMILNPLIVQTIYGNAYVDAIEISYILWIMRGINSGIRVIPMNMLAAIGKEKFVSISVIVSCVVQTSLDYILIKKMGVFGVAYGAIAVYLLTGILYWVLLLLYTRNGKIQFAKVV